MPGAMEGGPVGRGRSEPLMDIPELRRRARRLAVAIARRVYRPPSVAVPTPLPALERATHRALLIDQTMLPEAWLRNVAYPCLIRAPSWVANPLGRYYLFFSTHRHFGDIRLAVADDVLGPWRVRPDPVLERYLSWGVKAPDVVVDAERRRLVLYFTTGRPAGGETATVAAVSPDGHAFSPVGSYVGSFYFRVFRFDGSWFAVSKGGRLYRADDPLGPFVPGPDLFPRARKDPRYNAPGSVRHLAAEVTDAALFLYFSRIGDAPERILKAAVTTSGPWTGWTAGPPEEVIRPAAPWEGVHAPVGRSIFGAAEGQVHQLRDPYYYRDEDGSRYLLYAAAGEWGIGIARLGEAGFPHGSES